MSPARSGAAPPRRLVHGLAGVLPPPLRRGASGLWLDLKSLPARLADPARLTDPWAVAHNVGGGDYREVGRALVRELVDHAGLRPGDRVLDVGCGTGRVARALAEEFGLEGGYTGFDVSRRAIGYCRRRFAGRPDFRFVHADVRNGDYNAAGETAEAAYRFPVEPASADLVLATSVFSHMRLDAIARYLGEAARALRPGGRVAFTAYALTPERRARRAALALPLQPWSDGAMVMDPRSPERAIAHDAEALTERVAAAGLSLRAPWLRGGWAPEATYGGFQDLFVATLEPGPPGGAG